MNSFSLFFLITVSCFASIEMNHLDKENKIIRDIMSGTAPLMNTETKSINSKVKYNKLIRPQGVTGIDNNIDSNGALYIYLLLSLTHLIDFVEKYQMITTNSYLYISWVDARLSWDPSNISSEYYGVTRINVPSEMFWTPDLFVTNIHEGNGLIEISPSARLLVTNNGSNYLCVYLSHMQTNCFFDQHHYPFDNQYCAITIGSWQNDMNSFNFEFNDNSFIIDDFEQNPEWIIVNHSIETNRNSIRFKQINQQPDNPFQLYSEDVSFKIRLKRLPLYRMVNDILPCFILNSILLMNFFLPFTLQIQISK